MNGINSTDQAAYDHGIDPVTWAESIVGGLIDIQLTVIADRINDAGAWPGYHIEPTIQALASRIIGELLDAGWQLPGPPP